MNFVLDENLPARMARILSEFVQDSGHRVLHLASDLNLKGLADEDWFSRLDPNHDWVILTHDAGIRRNPHELSAWRSQGHRVFFLAKGWQNLQFRDQAWRLVRWWPDIVANAEMAQRGEAFSVTLNGKIESLEVKRRKRQRRRKQRQV